MLLAAQNEWMNCIDVEGEATMNYENAAKGSNVLESILIASLGLRIRQL